MLKRWQFWILTLLALAQAGVVATNVYIFGGNRKLQADVSQRAQVIQQSAPMEQLTRDMALALAQLAVRHQDGQIRSMLASLGISVNFNEDPARAAAPQAPEGKRK